MSFNEEIKIVNADNLSSQWDSLQEGEIFVLTNRPFEMIKRSFEQVRDVFKNDPSVGFITTDVEHYDNGMKLYRSSSVNDITDTPIFAKKISGLQINIDPNAKIISFARSYMNNGVKYEHLADAYFGFNV